MLSIAASLQVRAVAVGFCAHYHFLLLSMHTPASSVRLGFFTLLSNH